MGVAIVSSQADVTQKRVPHPRKLASAVWGMTEHSVLAAGPSILTPEAPAPDFPHLTLFHSALPLLEPRVSACE